MTQSRGFGVAWRKGEEIVRVRSVSKGGEIVRVWSGPSIAAKQTSATCKWGGGVYYNDNIFPSSSPTLGQAQMKTNTKLMKVRGQKRQPRWGRALNTPALRKGGRGGFNTVLAQGRKDVHTCHLQNLPRQGYWKDMSIQGDKDSTHSIDKAGRVKASCPQQLRNTHFPVIQKHDTQQIILLVTGYF